MLILGTVCPQRDRPRNKRAKAPEKRSWTEYFFILVFYLLKKEQFPKESP
jgi:hypothetical protein